MVTASSPPRDGAGDDPPQWSHGRLTVVGMRRPLAYRVPFALERGPATLYRLTNTSRETVSGVCLTLHGSGVMSANAPVSLSPGDALEVDIAGRNLSRDAILVVRWFRPDGVEYLWRIAF